MSSAGRHGTSDTGRANLPGDQGNPTGAGRPLMPGEYAPEDQIEVVEIIEVEDDTDGIGQGGFRWWYVPAIGLPIGVGAGAAIWYLTRGEEPYLNAWELVTRPARNLMGPSTTKKAARKARAKSNTLRDRVAGSLGGFDTAELAEKAGDLWDDARDSMVDLWDKITDRGAMNQARNTAEDARAAARRQIGRMVGSIAAAGTALAIQKKAGDLADAARMRAQAARDSAQSTTQRVPGRMATRTGKAALGAGLKGGSRLAKNRAQAKASDLSDRARRRAELIQRRGRFWMARNRAQPAVAMKAAKVRSARAAKTTRKRVTAPFRRMGVFALAALVTAMVIYVRSWYSRRGGTASGFDTGDMRETAGGRMEPDTWPRFAGRRANAAAPTATSSPTELS